MPINSIKLSKLFKKYEHRYNKTLIKILFRFFFIVCFLIKILNNFLNKNPLIDLKLKGVTKVVDLNFLWF